MADLPLDSTNPSNFFSGNRLGRIPFESPKKKKPLDIDPAKLPPDQIAALAAGVAGIPLTAAHSFLDGMIDELAGKKILSRFGGEDRIAPMVHDYLTQAAQKTDQEELLNLLDIKDLDKFAADYKPWMKTHQDVLNKERAQVGKMPIEGHGNLEMVSRRGLPATPSIGANLALQALAYQTKRALYDIETPGYKSESIFTKREQQQYLWKYLLKRAVERQNQLKSEITSSEKTAADVESQIQQATDRLNGLRRQSNELLSSIQAGKDIQAGKLGSDLTIQEQLSKLKLLQEQINNQKPLEAQVIAQEAAVTQLNNLSGSTQNSIRSLQVNLNSLVNKTNGAFADEKIKDPDKKTGDFSKLHVEFKKQILPDNSLKKFLEFVPKFYRGLDKFTKDPLGFAVSKAWDLAIGNRINDLLDQLEKRGPWGKVLRYIRKGPTGLLRSGASQVGKLLIRGMGKSNSTLLRFGSEGLVKLSPVVSRTFSAALRTVANLIKNVLVKVAKEGVKAVVRALLLVAEGWGVPIAAIVLLIIGCLVVIVMVVFSIFIIFQQAYSQQAANTIPPTAIQITSGKLYNLFQLAAQQEGIPLAMLLAIAQRESSTFSYTDANFDQFSTQDWWIGASPADLKTGYCYNTCSDPNLQCAPGSVVMGAMQFQQTTFNGLTSQIQAAVGHTPNTCNLEDSIYAAAIKIKQDSKTSPTNVTGWPDATVTSVAQSYCGSCSSKPCGLNYCADVLSYYKTYSAALGGGNQAIVNAYYQMYSTPGLFQTFINQGCGYLVNYVLGLAGYKTINTSYAVDFYSVAPTYGYQIFPLLSKEPAPGDMVVWYYPPTNPDLIPDYISGTHGAPGHIDVVVAVDAKSVYLSGNSYQHHAFARVIDPATGRQTLQGSSYLQMVGIIRATNASQVSTGRLQ